MTVHDVASYVKYHQQKLREQQAREASASSSQPQQRKGGVNNITSAAEFSESLKNNNIVVVDFFATWCGPCKAIAPTIAQWSNDPKYGGVTFVKVDVDNLSDVAAEHGISAMPTFHIFKNGQKIDEVVGAAPQQLKQKIDAVLKAQAEGVPYEAPPTPTNWMSYLPMIILAVLIYRWFMGI